MRSFIDAFISAVQGAVAKQEKEIPMNERKGMPLAVDSPHANTSNLSVDSDGFSKSQTSTNR